MPPTLEQRTIRKVSWRLLPLIVVIYFVARWHFCCACLLAAGGLVGAGLLGSTFATLAFMSVATVGLYGSKPAFWPLPSAFLTGTAAAGGIALVNSIGNLGGFVGPSVIGWIKEASGSFLGGLYVVAGLLCLSAILTLVLAGSQRNAQSLSANTDPVH